jgi:hypothetical protein
MRIATALLCIAMVSPCLAADYQAEVISPKQLVKSGYEPVIHTNYHAACGPGFSYEDVTTSYGIREPNLMVAKITCDNGTILKMKDDGFVVLWMKPVADAKTPPKQTKAELDTLKADLSAKGIIPADIAKTALSDTSKADVTAVDVATQLKAVMKEFPAAKVEEVKK